MEAFIKFRDFVHNKDITELTEVHVDEIIPDSKTIVAVNNIVSFIEEVGPKPLLCSYYFAIKVIRNMGESSVTSLCKFFQVMKIDFIHELSYLPTLWGKKYFYLESFKTFIDAYLKEVGTSPDVLIPALTSLREFRQTNPLYMALFYVSPFNPFDKFYVNYWGYTVPVEKDIVPAIPKYMYVANERVICADMDEFLENFSNFTCKLFESSETIKEPFDWSNIVISGGTVEMCLRKPFMNNFTSDVDIFIYGDLEVQKAKLIYLLRWFDSPKTYFLRFGSIFEIYFDDHSRKVQIIPQDEKSAANLIENFDVGYIQWAYDGNKVIGTPNAFSSMKTQTTVFTRMDTLCKAKRGCKALEKGYNISLPDAGLIERCKQTNNVAFIKSYSKFLHGSKDLPKRVQTEMNNMKTELSIYYYPSMSLQISNNKEDVFMQLQRGRNSPELFVTNKVEEMLEQVNVFGLQTIKNRSIDVYVNPFTIDLMDVQHKVPDIQWDRHTFKNVDNNRQLKVLLMPEHCTIVEISQTEPVFVKVMLSPEARACYNTIMEKIYKEAKQSKQKGQAVALAVDGPIVMNISNNAIIKTIDNEIIQDLPELPVQCQMVIKFTQAYGKKEINTVCISAVVNRKFEEIEEVDELPENDEIYEQNTPKNEVIAKEWENVV